VLYLNVVRDGKTARSTDSPNDNFQCSIPNGKINQIINNLNSNKMKKLETIAILVASQIFLPMSFFSIYHNAFAEAIICVIGWVTMNGITLLMLSSDKAEDVPMTATYNGQEFKDEQTIHEWREEFEFDYFIDNASQN
jgi:hypothetical protein